MVDLPAFIIIYVFWEHFNSSFVLKHQQHILKWSRLHFYYFINTINKEGDPLACIGYLNNNVKSDQAFTYRNTILLKWVPLTQGIIRCFNWNIFRRIFSTLYFLSNLSFLKPPFASKNKCDTEYLFIWIKIISAVFLSSNLC